jgi:hypothetical protein
MVMKGFGAGSQPWSCYVENLPDTGVSREGGFDAEDFYIAPWSQSSMPEIELSVKRGGEATDSVSVCP